VKQGPELLVGLQVLALTGVEISGDKNAASLIGAYVENRQVPLQEGQLVPFIFSSYFVVAQAVIRWGLGRWKCKNPRVELLLAISSVTAGQFLSARRISSGGLMKENIELKTLSYMFSFRNPVQACYLCGGCW
jgi:hypothetical protein